MPLDRIRSLVRDVPDFPISGILFKDIAPVLEDRHAFREAVNLLSLRFPAVDKVVGIESRGFVFASAIAYLAGAGTVMARKKGKLPYETVTEEHELEYGQGVLEMHIDSVRPGERVAIVDDVLATGGTAAAAVRLVERLGGEVVLLGFLIELPELAGRGRLPGYPIVSLLLF
jgi:adenine phosphoribosyltransferase